MSSPVPNSVLLCGVDTAEICYSLEWPADADLSFEGLLAERDHARKVRKAQPTVDCGGKSFLLMPHGARNGYPLILIGKDMTLKCGANNSPSFTVEFRSHALWKFGLNALHRDFLEWASVVGLIEIAPEKITRADVAFDFFLPALDFDEEHFVSRAESDAKYRSHRQVNGFQFGRDAVVLRCYDKVAEIAAQSDKTWLFKLWGMESGVWRAEAQVRKKVLRRFGIKTVDDLQASAGDLLRYCLTEHTSLRRPTADTNRSRWPFHPVWESILREVEQFDSTGIYREGINPVDLAEREVRLAIALHGYLKGCAAIQQFRSGRYPGLSWALDRMGALVHSVHEELAFRADVSRRVEKLKVGSW